MPRHECPGGHFAGGTTMPTTPEMKRNLQPVKATISMLKSRAMNPKVYNYHLLIIYMYKSCISRGHIY